MLWRRGKCYSQDLRERVFAAADVGEPVGRIAAMLRVSVSDVSKVLSRRRLTGQTMARPQRCPVAPKRSGLHPAILAQVSRRPDATIAEWRAWRLETHKGIVNLTSHDHVWAESGGVGCHHAAIRAHVSSCQTLKAVAREIR